MSHIDPAVQTCAYCGHDLAGSATCPTCGCHQREGR